MGRQTTDTRKGIAVRREKQWWSLNKLCVKKFLKQLGNMVCEEEANSPEAFIQKIKRAGEGATPKTTGSKNKKPVYWWTENIDLLRRSCLKARRNMTRTNKKSRRNEYEQTREEYKEAKKLLKNAILKAKDAQWIRLCEEVEDDIYGEMGIAL